MSPWRYKEDDRNHVCCVLFKAEAMLGALRVAFLASPLGQRGED